MLALAVIGWTGSQAVAEDIVPTAFWLLIWIAVPISCGLIGDWTRPVNPFAALARIFDRDRLRRAVLGSAHRVGWPAWLGYWPAALLFFTLACGELVYNATATLPAFTATSLVVYVVINAGRRGAGSAGFGSGRRGRAGSWAASRRRSRRR
jgi:hypothetical protein